MEMVRGSCCLVVVFVVVKQREQQARKQREKIVGKIVWLVAVVKLLVVKLSQETKMMSSIVIMRVFQITQCDTKQNRTTKLAARKAF